MCGVRGCGGCFLQIPDEKKNTERKVDFRQDYFE